MSSHAVRPRVVRSVELHNRVIHNAAHPLMRKRRQPATEADNSPFLSSSAPSIRTAVAVTAATACSAASSPLVPGRAVMATVCTVAAAPLSSSSSSSHSPYPPASRALVTRAVALSAPAWPTRSSKRSKAAILSSPWSDAHDSFGDWLAPRDGSSPTSSVSSDKPTPVHLGYMHRRSSLPCLPSPALSSPRSPGSDNSVSSCSDAGCLPSLPSDLSRLQSAPAVSRTLSNSSRRPSGASGNREVLPPPVNDVNSGAASSSANRFASLHVLLASHPAIQRLQQLEEQVAVKDEVQPEEEDDDEVQQDDEYNVEAQLYMQQLEHQPFRLEAKENFNGPSFPIAASGDVMSAYPVTDSPIVDEAEHAPLAGLVTAFPFVQQFIPQPSRAEKKKQFIQRIHSTRQLSIRNYTPPALHDVRPTPVFRPSFPPAPINVVEAHAMPTHFRSVSSSPTVSSTDESHEELSSEYESSSHGDYSSSSLADTFASLSPHFVRGRHSNDFSFPVPPPIAPLLASPLLSSSFNVPRLPSPVHHSLPAVFSPPALFDRSESSVCPELVLGERAWDDDGQWLSNW